ncbi:hypothetical protein L1987_87557 [Smallanthus sonchifolius]|nr:hypothetical protein L1987_87557 [Smallanthus sonchifolius]
MIHRNGRERVVAATYGTSHLELIHRAKLNFCQLRGWTILNECVSVVSSTCMKIKKLMPLDTESRRLIDCIEKEQEQKEKYETTASLAETEKRVVMAESMLEATLQYQSGQNKVQSYPSPKTVENLQGKLIEEQTNIKVTGDEQNAKAVQDGENCDQIENVSLADDGK